MNTTLIERVSSIVIALLLYSYVAINTAEEDDPFCVVIEGACFMCSSEKINGTMVEEHCYNESRYPAIINSTTQLAGIKDKCLPKGSPSPIWVNTYRLNGSFFWNADSSPVEKTLWGPRLPNPMGDCVSYDKHLKKLKNIACHFKNTYICAYTTEIRIEETTEEPKPIVEEGKVNSAEANTSETDSKVKGSACKNCLGNNCQGCKVGCVDGFYDEGCNTECSTKCKPRVCEKSNGSCVTMATGKAENKTLSCSKHCSPPSNSCDTTTASCSKGCETGYYGPNCDKACSSACTNHRCDQNSGHCSDGCTPGQNKTECQVPKGSAATGASGEDSMVTFVWITVPLVSALISAAIIGVVVLRRKKATKIVANEGGDDEGVE